MGFIGWFIRLASLFERMPARRTFKRSLEVCRPSMPLAAVAPRADRSGAVCIENPQPETT
jgi:hypothetical protein